MMIPLRIKKCKKKLKSLYDIRKMYKKELETISEISECENCYFYNTKPVASFAERYINCEECDKSYRLLEIAKQLDCVLAEIDNYIENDYALAVYDEFSKKNIVLVNTITNEEISFCEAFGVDFNKIDNGLRHSLVGLVETELRYKIK